MANSFYRSRQSLRNDNGLKSIKGLGLALLLGAAWIYWAWDARITRYETSESARLEIDSAAYPVQANAAGQIACSALTLAAGIQRGECPALHPGAHISEGQQLGVIVPQGRMQMVAQFEPSAALGKIRPGQPAIVRLEGFPWTQFGTLSAEVSRVAGDIRGGKVEVELDVKAGANPRIHLQHGMPGSVEVEIGSLSPLAFVLGAAGRFMGAD